MSTFSIDPHGHMTEAQVRRRARQLSRALWHEHGFERHHSALDGRELPLGVPQARPPRNPKPRLATDANA
jgi:hypothetical protein